MNNRAVKSTAWALSSILLFSALTACGSNDNNDSAAGGQSSPAGESSAATQAADASGVPEENVTLRLLYPGDESKRMAEFLKNENAQKMKEDLNINLDVTWAPWGEYWNKKDIMLAAGEQIDWYMDGYSGLAKTVQQGLAMPLDDLLDKYAPDYKRLMPPEHLEPFRVNGKLMALPMTYAPSSEKFKSILVRKDLMDKVGITDIKSIADLENYYLKVKEIMPEARFLATIPIFGLMRELQPYNFSFTQGNMIIVNEDDKTAQMLPLTPGWKSLAKLMSEWSKKGYIAEDLIIKPGEELNRFTSGIYIARSGAISADIEDLAGVRNNVPDAELAEYLLGENKGKYKTQSSNETFIIPVTAKHPERAMMMLNWFYKSQENNLFAIYGVEGKDYTIENDKINQINKDSLWYEWMFRHLDYMKFPASVPERSIESFKNWDNGAQLSAIYGFVFDNSSVADLEVKLSTFYKEKLEPYAMGFTEYDEAKLDALLEEYKALGGDKVAAEFQKQMDAYVASK